jgi:8-oxo-dGTP pyrophosphatase MutT (NUDIX family)
MNTPAPAGFLAVHIDKTDAPSGFILPRIAERLASHGLGRISDRHFDLPAPGLGLEELFAKAHDNLHAIGLVGPMRGEAMSVLTDWDSPALATVDRSLLRVFGFRGVKVHINGIIRTNGGTKFWLARRAADRRASPLHLDTMVAGGQPHGKSPWDTAIMEAGEEAGLEPHALAAMREIKRIDLDYGTTEGFHRERLIIYDLELPETFRPELRDGELIESLLVSAQKMVELLDGGDKFKWNSAVVCRDLLDRHAQVQPISP